MNRHLITQELNIHGAMLQDKMECVTMLKMSRIMDSTARSCRSNWLYLDRYHLCFFKVYPLAFHLEVPFWDATRMLWFPVLSRNIVVARHGSSIQHRYRLRDMNQFNTGIIYI